MFFCSSSAKNRTFQGTIGEHVVCSKKVVVVLIKSDQDPGVAAPSAGSCRCSYAARKLEKSRRPDLLPHLHEGTQVQHLCRASEEHGSCDTYIYIYIYCYSTCLWRYVGFTVHLCPNVAWDDDLSRCSGVLLQFSSSTTSQ